MILVLKVGSGWLLDNMERIKYTNKINNVLNGKNRL